MKKSKKMPNFSNEIIFYDIQRDLTGQFELNTNISDNFTLLELFNATKLTSSELSELESIPIHQYIVNASQFLRDQFQLPLFWGSAYRSPLWETSKNRNIFGSHPQALAIDINGGSSQEQQDLFTNWIFDCYQTKNHVYEYLKTLGVNSWGFYEWGVHLDFRPRKLDNTDRFWDDRKKKV